MDSKNFHISLSREISGFSDFWPLATPLRGPRDPHFKNPWDRMNDLRLDNNQLSGKINLTKLPNGIASLSLNNNQFTGEIDLTNLPSGLESLYLTNNQFTGELDLTHLPGGMQKLHLNDNQLTGEIDLTHLSDGMGYLTADNNRLTGSLVIKNLPPRISLIDMRGNHFNAIAVVEPKKHIAVKLKGSGVTSVVDENGMEIHSKWFFA